MSGIVQATCPGCKNILRIPTDWIHQPIRCKHCGLVMLSKNLPVGLAAGPKNKTPLPAGQPLAAATPASANVHKVVAPQAVAETVQWPATAGTGSPFTELSATEANGDVAAKSARQQVRKRPSLWKGVVITSTVVVLAVAILAGVVVGLGLANLNKLLPASSAAVVIKDKEEGPPDKDKVGAKDSPATDGKVDPNKEKPPPPKDKPADPNKDKTTKPAPVAGPGFPRRALIISLHHYLYADTLSPGNLAEGAHNIATLKDKLTNGLRIPRTQIGLLSDVVPRGVAHSPTKSVIQETLVKFLATSRAQDRIVVFFIGHAVEIGDDVYLVPIEGEQDNPGNLIPLKWVYRELADCRARQKVLVLDVCRSNPGRGAGPSGTKPMGPKLSAAVSAPPDGVQVWSACSAGQFSYETDASPMGVFLDKLLMALESGLKNKVQHEEDALPIELFNDTLAAAMKAELAALKLTQEPRVAGREAPAGAAYNKNEPPPPSPTVAENSAAKDNAKVIQGVLNEISLPPIKGGFGGGGEVALKGEMLPAFDAKTMAEYAPADSKLRGEIKKVRVTLWAYAPTLPNLPPPADLKNEVADKRKDFNNISMAMLKENINYPPNENNFKNAIAGEEREVGKMLSNLIRLRKDFIDPDTTGKDRKEEPSKRWQVNYDYVRAHLEAQIAFLYEYQAMLGGLRRELPPKEPGTNRWRMVATSTPSLDSDGKKMAASSGKILDALLTENANTPWFVLAKRERMVFLGLEWKSVK